MGRNADAVQRCLGKSLLGIGVCGEASTDATYPRWPTGREEALDVDMMAVAEATEEEGGRG